MDSEFLALSLVFILLGSTGIILFYGPLTPAGDSCYCLIPSPEPGAAQGTSSIFLALGILFLPMGLLKGGPPVLRRTGPPATLQGPGGVTYTAPDITSGSLFTIGVVLLLIGIDALFVPGFIVLKSTPLEVGGIVLGALGAVSLLFGWLRPKQKK